MVSCSVFFAAGSLDDDDLDEDFLEELLLGDVLAGLSPGVVAFFPSS